MIASDPALSQGDAPSDEKQPDVSRISIRFAKPYDATRFVTRRVVSGPVPATKVMRV